MSLFQFLTASGASQGTSSRKPDDTLLLVADQPNQPSNLKFPKREFGCKTKVKRSFQATWFKRWRWLHYDESNDVAFCYWCIKAYKEKKLTVSNADKAFITFCDSLTK